MTKPKTYLANCVNIILIFLLFSNSVSSQNLLKNSSFEKKNDTKFSYANADKTLAEWTCEKFVGPSLYHPSDAHYVDTCLFQKFIDEGFPLLPEVRKTVVQPYSGTCYIKGNSFRRVLFHQELAKSTNLQVPYIIQFYYQIKSLSNEYEKINSAHFGVSLFKKPIDLKYMRSSKYAKELSMRYRNYVFINEFDSLSKNNWVKFQANIQSSKTLSDFYLGNHTDFETSIVPKKGTYGGVRGNYQDSFIFFVDQVKLIKLSDYLSGSISDLKNTVFSIPIEFNLNNNVLFANAYLKQVINQLKKNPYDTIRLAIENNEDRELQNKLLQLVCDQLIKSGVNKESIICSGEIKTNLVTSKDLSPKGTQLKIFIE